MVIFNVDIFDNVKEIFDIVTVTYNYIDPRQRLLGLQDKVQEGCRIINI